jgi:murein DD-endopeptidase MepM/ murein hydrolase activator NlpD
VRWAEGKATWHGRVLAWLTLFAFTGGFSAGVLTSQTSDRPGQPGPSETVGVDDLTPGSHLRGAQALAARPTLWSPGAQLSAAQMLEAPAEPARFAEPWPVEGRLQVTSRVIETAPEARLAKAALPRSDFSIEQVTVERGDTLMDILSRAGIGAAEAYAAAQSLRKVYDPRRLRAGQELLITAAAPETGANVADGAPRRLIGLALDLSFDHAIRVTRDADGNYAAAKLERPQQRQTVHRFGEISDSLYLAAQRAELPSNLTAEVIKLFSWDVDFQRDIQPGDRFETLFEEVSLRDGAPLHDARSSVRGGDLLYARLTLSGRDLEAYRFVLPDGSVEYYDRTGRSLRKFLLRTPVDGARLSSRFGMRRHPILGYTRMHKGVDFAAPSGTPIYAAGNGKVTKAGRNGGYGNYVEIRHNGEYSTAYAHLSRFAKGMSPGRRVSQGQVIGYVGTTGRSTGPHLHFEVRRNGSQINPLKLKSVALAQLGSKDLERFKTEMARIDRMRQDLADGTQLASKAD